MATRSNLHLRRYGAALVVLMAAVLWALPPASSAPPRRGGRARGAQDQAAQAQTAPTKAADHPTFTLPDGRVVGLVSQAEHSERLRIAALLAGRTESADLKKHKHDHTPDVAETLKDQTPIENQGGRGTCTYFAATAALEAAYKKAGYGDLDLSEQYLDWLRDVTMLTDDAQPASSPTLVDAYVREDQPGSLSGGSGVGNLDLLTHYGICPARDDPYIGDPAYEDYTSSYYTGYGMENYQWQYGLFPQASINKWNMAAAQLPADLQSAKLYGVEKYVSLAQSDVQDARSIEWLISQGHSVVMDLQLFSDPYDPARPIWKRNAKLNDKVTGGHAVLIVGYDRPRHFFVLKNSWGPVHYDASKLATDLADIATKYDGYQLMDYNYLTGAEGAGYVTGVLKPDSDRFQFQRLLGNWALQIKKKGTDKVLLKGTLTWRHIPGTDPTANEKEQRVGDLLRANSKAFRVNGVVDPKYITLFIDFGHPGTNLTDRSGVGFLGNLSKESGKLVVSGDLNEVSGGPKLQGTPLTDLTFTMVHE